METEKMIAIGSRTRILPNEVVLLTADINYTQILCSNGSKLVVATTLKELEKRFSTCTDFFRTHKSFLININYINSYNIAREDEFVQMKNGYRANISRRKKKAFIERISL